MSRALAVTTFITGVFLGIAAMTNGARSLDVLRVALAVNGGQPAG